MSEMGNARDFTLETRSQYLESKTATILESKPELQSDAYSQSSKQMPIQKLEREHNVDAFGKTQPQKAQTNFVPKSFVEREVHEPKVGLAAKYHVKSKHPFEV